MRGVNQCHVMSSNSKTVIQELFTVSWENAVLIAETLERIFVIILLGKTKRVTGLFATDIHMRWIRTCIIAAYIFECGKEFKDSDGVTQRLQNVLPF